MKFVILLNLIFGFGFGNDKIVVLPSTLSDSSYGINFIEKLRPVQFTWKIRGDMTKDGKKRVGFIAQELQDAMPDGQNEILDLVYESNPERLEAKQGNLIPIMVKALQDLQSMVKELQEDNKTLRQELQNMKE